MIRDEFNQIEVTNDKQLLQTEFGKTQNAEFSSQQENKTPEGDLNEKYIGKTIRKETEVNVDYINKVPSHGAQTVVTSTGTATTAAAATAGTAVAASTVAVVAIATVTGISAAIHDYQYEFKSLIISSNELRYELYVYDAMLEDDEYLSFEDQESTSEDQEFDEISKAPFALHVFNQNYDATQYLWDRSTNMGVFDHLTLGDSYNIVLSENRYGGEEIYKDTFVTYVNSSIIDFTVYPYTDYVSGTFDYNLDFVDDDNSISDIVLEFYEPEFPEEIVAAFAIEKEKGYQTMSVKDDNSGALIDLNKEWGYRLSYKKGEEREIYKEDTIAFEDYAGRKSVFNNFVFDKKANFIDNSITVTLDYVDSLGWYEDFKLELTQIPIESDPTVGQDNYYSQEIPLAATTEPQTIILNEYEMYVRDEHFQYTYRLSCTYCGDLTTLKEETEPFSFTDMSGGVSEFNGFEFKKEANFLNNTFKVRIDYQDDFYAFYGFTLHLLPDGVNAQYDFTLQETNEEQTCEFNENDHYDFSFDYSYTWYLTYYKDGEEIRYQPETEEFTFTDISGGVSDFNGITFTGRYVMATGLAPVQLDYQDDFEYLSNFVLHLYGPVAPQGGTPNPFLPNRAGGSDDTPEIDDYPYVFSLEKTTKVQYINLYESQVPTSMEGEYLYALTYDYRGQAQEPVYGDSNIIFDDPDAESIVNGIEFVDGEANFNNRSFVVKLDFKDDYGYFDRFTLQVRDTANGGWVERELDKTTEPQNVVIDDWDDEEYKYPVDIVEGTLFYNLTYTSAETGDPATQYLYEEEQPLSFTNSLKSEFYGLDTSYDFTTNEYNESRLPFRFDCVNDAEYFSAPELYFTPVGNEEEILATMSFQNEVMNSEWQYGSFSPYGSFTIEDLTNGEEYGVMVAYYAKDGYNGSDQRVTRLIGNHAFTLNQKQEIYNASIANYIVAGNWEMSMSLIANGNYDLFSDGELILTTADDVVYTYDLGLTTEYTSVYLNSPKENSLSDDDLEAIFANPVSVSIRYCVLIENQSGTGYDKSETITVNCLTSYQFFVSHQLTNVEININIGGYYL